MQDNLYRPEAIEQAGAKHLGEPRIDSATGFALFTICLFALLILAGTLLGSATYTRKHKVNGLLDENNATAIIAGDFGNLSTLSVREGDRVESGQALGTIQRLQGPNPGVDLELNHQLQHWQQAIEATQENSEAQILHFETMDQQLRQVMTLTRHDIQLQQTKVKKLQSQTDRAASLLDEGYLSSLDWLNFQTNLIAEKQMLMRQKKAFVELNGQRESLLDERRVFDANTVRRLAELDLRSSESRQRLLEHQQRQNHILRASISGRVTRIVTPLGTALTPGQTLLYVSASEQNYSATLMVPTHVAGHVKVGQELRLELDSFPAETWGRIKATVTNLSSHTVSDANQNAAYLARLDVEPHAKIERLMPGMRFSTFVEVDSHTLFEWLLKPLSKLKETIG